MASSRRTLWAFVSATLLAAACASAASAASTIYPNDNTRGAAASIQCTTDPRGNLYTLVPTISTRSDRLDGDPDGAFVQKFDSRGRAVRSFGRKSVIAGLSPRVPSFIKADSKGRALLVSAQGNRNAETPRWVVSRVAANGKRDRKFAFSGSLRLKIYAPTNDPPTVTPLRSGRIAILARSYTGTGRAEQFFIMLDSKGRFDKTFDPDGIKLLKYYADSIVEMSDRRMVLAGRTKNDPLAHNEIIVNRLQQNGNADASFGKSGLVRQGEVPANIWNAYLPGAGAPKLFNHTQVRAGLLASSGLQLAITTSLPPTDAYESNLGWAMRLTASGAVDGGYGTAGAAYVANLDMLTGTEIVSSEQQTMLPLNNGRVFNGEFFFSSISKSGASVVGRTLSFTGQPAIGAPSSFRLRGFIGNSIAFDAKQKNAYVCGFKRDKLIVSKKRVR